MMRLVSSDCTLATVVSGEAPLVPERKLTLGELAKLLPRNAKKFRNSAEGFAMVANWRNHVINAALAADVVRPITLLCQIERPDCIDLLNVRLEKWCLNALDSISRNSHMNETDGESILTQNTADALMVDFCNFACAPLDLAMYSQDLRDSLAPAVEVLPARPDPIKINLNDMAMVQLTPDGMAAVHIHYQRMVENGFPQSMADQCIARLTTTNAEGYTEMSLHEMMYLFGPMMTPFNQKPPIKMNIAVRRMF